MSGKARLAAGREPMGALAPDTVFVRFRSDVTGRVTTWRQDRHQLDASILVVIILQLS